VIHDIIEDQEIRLQPLDAPAEYASLEEFFLTGIIDQATQGRDDGHPTILLTMWHVILAYKNNTGYLPRNINSPGFSQKKMGIFYFPPKVY